MTVCDESGIDYTATLGLYISKFIKQKVLMK
jgi:hypothetical protein